MKRLMIGATLVAVLVGAAILRAGGGKGRPLAEWDRERIKAEAEAEAGYDRQLAEWDRERVRAEAEVAALIDAGKAADRADRERRKAGEDDGGADPSPSKRGRARP